MELFELTALQLGCAIRAGEVSIPEVTRAALDCAAKAPHNAFITLTADQAVAQAESLQKRQKDAESPLYGVPMSFKDNICTEGIKTSCASKILGDFRPPYSATAVDLINHAGAIFIGKTNMDEFAMGSTSETSFYGPVKNPWALTRSPGGSSGGAAASVAEGSCWFALGSDTGGSVRQPASHCGLTGMKPTYGTVSRYGLIAYASSLDQIGPLCRDAADCAAVLDVIQRRDCRDGTSLDRDYGHLLKDLTGDMRGKTIGIPAECFGDGLNSEVRKSVLAVADVLKGRGASVEEFSLPILPYVVPAYYIIACAEASSNLSRFDGVQYGWRAGECETLNDLYCKTRTEGFGSEVKRRILLGTFVLSAGYYDAYYKKALQAKVLIRQAFEQAFSRYDLLLTPVSPTTAPRLGESLSNPLQMYLNDIYTVPANLAGLPALSMPCGFDSDGLPIGAQLIGPHFGEGTILNAAHAFQLETDYHRQTLTIPLIRHGCAVPPFPQEEGKKEGVLE